MMISIYICHPDSIIKIYSIFFIIYSSVFPSIRQSDLYFYVF